jgi:hypothetical protein
VSENYSTSLSATMRALCEKHGVAYGHYGRNEPGEVFSEVAAQRFAGEQLAFELEQSG